MDSVKEVIWIVDAEDSLREYVKKKYKHNTEFVDIKARNAFSNKGIIASIITCSHGYNYYSMRNEIINQSLIDSECPRCNKLEIWDHVIKCPTTKELQWEFIKETAKEMIKKNKGEINVEEILDMLEGIVNYLQNGDPDEYETN